MTPNELKLFLSGLRSLVDAADSLQARGELPAELRRALGELHRMAGGLLREADAAPPPKVGKFPTFLRLPPPEVVNLTSCPPMAPPELRKFRSCPRRTPLQLAKFASCPPMILRKVVNFPTFPRRCRS